MGKTEKVNRPERQALMKRSQRRRSQESFISARVGEAPVESSTDWFVHTEEGAKRACTAENKESVLWYILLIR